MALGLISNDDSRTFLPIVKYDSRSGRIFRVDREDGVSTPVDISKNFSAVIDLGNIEIGWINFPAGSAPEFVMAHYSETCPARPSDAHKKGSRVIMKLSPACGGGLREMASNSKVFSIGIENLFKEYEDAIGSNQGKLPVVVLADTIPVVAGSGAQKSTNYAPKWEIVKWVPRPDDLIYQAKAAPIASTSSPSTGSKTVSAPVAAKKVDSDNDWG